AEDDPLGICEPDRLHDVDRAGRFEEEEQDEKDEERVRRGMVRQLVFVAPDVLLEFRNGGVLKMATYVCVLQVCDRIERRLRALARDDVGIGLVDAASSVFASVGD